MHRGGDDWMDGDAAIASAQVGCLAAALIAINNLRDARTDAEVGKRTLPVVFGETFGRWEITALVCAPFALNAYWAATRRDATMSPGSLGGGSRPRRRRSPRTSRGARGRTTWRRRSLTA